MMAKKNYLLEYSEILACEVVQLCHNYKIDANTVYQIKNLPLVSLPISPRLNILKVLPICFQSSRLQEKNVWKQKVG